MLLAVELLDELVGGTLAAAWPLIRGELELSYVQVGLLLSVPGFVGSALDPLIGAFGDTRRRHALIVGGGIAFSLSVAVAASAAGFGMLLAALVVFNPASGAFVSLAQATLMDTAPVDRERNMARWTLAGSFGYVGGPVLIAGALWLDLGWRVVLAALAVTALPLVAAMRRVQQPAVDRDSAVASLRHALAVLRRGEVLRWLAVLEAVDLLLDVFHAFLALYLVDVARVRPAEAALGVGVWTAAGLVGDWLVLIVLRRMSGLRYLRLTAALALAAYPAFLIVPTFGAKVALAVLLGLLNSGWYAIPQARLYAALPDRSGVVVAVGGAGGLVGAAIPLALGVIAGAAGLAATMWILVLAPVALLALVPRERLR